MLEAKLFRIRQTDTYTMGVLVIKNQFIFILERPWLNNKNNISCIPTGKYLVNYLAKSASGKYRDVYHVTNVPNRVGILIHKGNLVLHTLGCLITGSRRGKLKGMPAVLGSAAALRKLHSLANRKSFMLEVI